VEFTKLSQIALQVTDIEASLKFYCENLGLRHLFNFCDENNKPWMYYLRVSDYQYLELIPRKEKTPAGEGSFHHMGLIVEDVHAAAQELLQKGVKLYHGPAAMNHGFMAAEEITPGLDNNLSFYTEDPDHNNVEIMQFSKDAKQHPYEK
jgi:lactoylglutathione lyase